MKHACRPDKVRFHRPYVYTLEPETIASSGSASCDLVIQQAPFYAEGFASTGALSSPRSAPQLKDNAPIPLEGAQLAKCPLSKCQRCAVAQARSAFAANTAWRPVLGRSLGQLHRGRQVLRATGPRLGDRKALP